MSQLPKQRVADQSTEAQVAQEAYEKLGWYHEVQIPAIQSSQSEIHVAKDLAESLERTAASLQPNVQQLRGLLHPLLHCPDDVLRLVFGEVIWALGIPFSAATTLSHVCQRWRAIAISSPRLWSCFGLDFGHSDKAVDFRVQTFLKRVKEAPAAITLGFEGEDAPVLDRHIIKIRAMGEVLKASRVCDLDILISEPFKYSSVLEAISPFPRHRIKDLTIAVFSSQEDSQGSFDDFLSRFGSIRNLRLDGGAFGLGPNQNIQSAFVHIHDVTLHHVRQLPLSTLLRMMPNLQGLELKDCSVTPEPEGGTNRILLPNLLSLHSRAVAIPWQTMDCPLIARIILIKTPALDNTALWTFLSSARTLTEIRLNPSPSQLSKLARVAPQIQNLYIKVTRGNGAVLSVLVQWRRFGLDGPAFPNLRRMYLTIRTSGDTTLTEQLNSLIQARCSSEAHSESKMEGVIPLDAFGIMTKPGPAAWNPNPHFTNYFPQPARFNLDGDLFYRFAGSHGQ